MKKEGKQRTIGKRRGGGKERKGKERKGKEENRTEGNQRGIKRKRDEMRGE